MYALVSFSFAGGHFSSKKYFFKSNNENFKLGDLVVVEGILPGETTIAMFIRYEEEDLSTQFERKSILRKAHGNTLKSIAKKRHQYFLTFDISKEALGMAKKNFSEFEGKTDEEIKNTLIKRLSVAPKRLVRPKNLERYYYDHMQITVKDNEVVGVTANIKDTTWRFPTQLESYLI